MKTVTLRGLWYPLVAADFDGSDSKTKWFLDVTEEQIVSDGDVGKKERRRHPRRYVRLKPPKPGKRYDGLKVLKRRLNRLGFELVHDSAPAPFYHGWNVAPKRKGGAA
jgi:hypothetical protein